jgi:hypothetical protein
MKKQDDEFTRMFKRMCIIAIIFVLFTFIALFSGLRACSDAGGIGGIIGKQVDEYEKVRGEQ